jgi:hypothetical protein
MRFATKSFAITGVIAALTLLLLAVGPVDAHDDLKLQVLTQSVSPEVQFDLKIKAYNFTGHEVVFNRVAVAYLNPDLTVRGPYLVSSTERKVPITASESTPYTFTVPLRILTTQSPGTLVPILVTLWYNHYTAGYQRGAGAGAVKIK